MIVVTEADVDENIIYTNNPQGYFGEQISLRNLIMGTLFAMEQTIPL